VRWDLIGYRAEGVRPPSCVILRLLTLRATREAEILSSSTPSELNAQAHNYDGLSAPLQVHGTQLEVLCFPRV
jgi:hypothetical protein